MSTLHGNFEWYPGRILREQKHASVCEFTLIVLNQPLQDIQVFGKLWANATHRVAADGGANRLLEAAGLPWEGPSSSRLTFDDVDVIIGDLDSLEDETKGYYASLPTPPKIIADPDQYSTDFGKAVSHSRHLKPSVDIVAVGGLGGRVDQGLSQLHHLYLFQSAPGYKEGRLYLVSGESLTFLLKSGKHRIWVREEDGEEAVFGKHVGIIPVKEPSVITTKGLEWDVSNWRTEFGGQISTSNHVLPDTKVIEVETDKDVIFTIALSR